MAKTEANLGPRVRALRQQEEMTQVALAEALDISPSYLNLIEHGRRPLPAHLLIKLAQVFDIDLADFGSQQNEQVKQELEEVFSDDMFEEQPVSDVELTDLATQAPSVARAISRLYENYRESQEKLKTLTSRVNTGVEASDIESWRLPSEEVHQLLQREMNYFPQLEEAADDLHSSLGLAGSDDLYGRLVHYLRQAHDIRVQIRRADHMKRMTRHFDDATGILQISEVLPPNSINFQLAHQIALLEHSNLLNQIIEAAKLSTDESRSLGRVALANYFAAATMMPYDTFWEAAEEQRYDIDRLGHRFRASFEQVAQRLTSLRKPGKEGVPFHFVRVDIAGNISKRFSASGISFARFSGACPRWNLVACFLTPGQIRTQLSQMVDGEVYFCIARTVSSGERGFHTPPAMHAICLGCSVEDAARLVYSDGINLENVDAAVPVGVTCRLCERMDCEQRAFPPLQKTLHIDENVRGHSFYASVKE
jgi:predicted transcriptional regulator/DNA-binding XRE family transcriptional regulator